MAAEGNNEEITVEKLEQSLEELIKAASSTDADAAVEALRKGGSVDSNRVEHSGTRGSDGEQGGGRGSGSASLDKMMIAKFADMGFDVGQIAAIEGALTGKAKDDEDEDEESMAGYMGRSADHAAAYAKKNGGKMAGYTGMPYSKSDAGTTAADELTKSMDSFKEDPALADSVDVSAFLEAYVSGTAKQIGDLSALQKSGQDNQATCNRAMAAGMFQIGTLIKSQQGVIEVLGQRLGIVEKTPNAPKGVTTAAALSKGMPGENGGDGELKLTKAEAIATLSYMNLEKGIKTIDGQSTTTAISLFEGGNVYPESVAAAVASFHKANPNLSAEARAYH